MKKLITAAIFIAASYVLYPSPMASSDAGISYRIWNAPGQSCERAENEFRLGVDSELEHKLGLALLHFQEAHNLCPQNPIFEDEYFRLQKELENVTWYKS